VTTRYIRTNARDRRLAAIHEAGHYVAARWRGVKAYAYIFPAPADQPFEKTWLGQTGAAETTADTDRLIGVAGAVAEECWLYRNEPSELEQPWFWEEHFEDPNAMSRSDWQRAHTRPGNPSDRLMRAVRTIHAAFDPRPGRSGHLWPELCSVARELIVHSRPLLRQAA
jgi:hypothetical protein